jgi:hypothetical protein
LARFPRKANFSCFGNHPDLESRLTFQEKWVVAAAAGGSLTDIETTVAMSAKDAAATFEAAGKAAKGFRSAGRA